MGAGKHTFFFYLITVDKQQQKKEKREKTIAKDGLSIIAFQYIVVSKTATLIEVYRDVSSCTVNFMQIKSVKLQLFGLIKGLNRHPRGIHTPSLTSK